MTQSRGHARSSYQLRLTSPAQKWCGATIPPTTREGKKELGDTLYVPCTPDRVTPPHAISRHNRYHFVAWLEWTGVSPDAASFSFSFSSHLTTGMAWVVFRRRMRGP